MLKPKKLVRSSIIKHLWNWEWEEVYNRNELKELYALKVEEELREIQNSNYEDVNEFADLLEVVLAFARVCNFPKTRLDSIIIDKMLKKGVYDDLVLSNLNPSNPSNKLYFDKTKRIILVGKGGGGKDFFKDYLNAEGFKVDVSYTTRPKREGEIEGVTYNYITEEKFTELVNQDFFYEAVEFNGWKYGTSKKDWLTKKVCIKTPQGISGLTVKDIEESVVVFFDIDEEVRIERLKKRSDADKIERRLKSDEIDFKDFKQFNIKITDPNFNPAEVLKKIENYIK